jgi:hypothetical protein
MASCAVLRTIGSKKLPPEARRIRISPVGVVDVDVAAVEGGKTPVQPDTVYFAWPEGWQWRGGRTSSNKTLYDPAPLFKCVEIVQDELISDK